MSWLQALGARYRVSADPLRTQRRLELVALLLGLAVSLQLAYSGFRLVTLGAPESVEPAADSLRVPVVLGPQVVAASERNEIISRPVFWPGRRPVAAVATLTDASADGEKPAELSSVKLVGVFGGADRAGIIALVDGKKRRILVGEELEGWQLDSIEPTGGLFTRGTRRELLSLERGTVKVASPRAAAAASEPGSVVAPVAPAPGVEGAGAGAGGPEDKAEAEATLGLGPSGPFKWVGE